ncbi:hypothetical protein U9M48_031927 [Paspalum notatum var. saurae]|uniref:Uncharacterized protein n=1 Tax=Paspalum notatum var. saurae TaxID=547442 RepID=A0AAQ3U8B9_PASNO
MLFVTINDRPTLANMPRQSNKGFRACIHCLDETESTHLKHCRKVVYVGGHRRFLGGKHLVRKKGKHFNGKEENHGKPIHHSGKLVFKMVKSRSVVFGKGPGSHVPNENEKAPMWKKKIYILVLDVRHAIDVMHLTKNLCVNLLGFLRMYGKNNDTLEAREDMATLKSKHYLGTASYSLGKREKESMFECLDESQWTGLISLLV